MSDAPATFAIFGTGGVGGFFGAQLARAGIDVTFIARGPHLEAIITNGLTIDDGDNGYTIDVRATDDPATIGTVDYVLFAVKLWDCASAAAACQPMIGPDTAVVSLLNGVDSEPILADTLGARHVMGGVAEISAVISKPGTVKVMSPFRFIRAGELNGTRSERGLRLGAAFSKAGVDFELSQDIDAVIWRKFVLLSALSALTALTRHTLGELRDDPDTRQLLQQAMEETAAVAAAKDVALDPNLVIKLMGFMDKAPADMRASMAMDLAEGRRLELPWLSGAVARLGVELGVPTPAHTFVATALKLDVMGR